MTQFDDQIREALRREDAELMELDEIEPPFHESLIRTFVGRRVWLNGLVAVFTFMFVGLAIFALYGFSQAEGTRPSIAWASGFLWASLAVAMLKLWLWMEIQRNSVVREIKRLELQIAKLSRRIDAQQP